MPYERSVGGRNYEAGSSEFIEAYYQLGEYAFYNDLANFITATSGFTLGAIRERGVSGDVLPDVKTFLGVMKLVAKRTDDKYASELRQRVKVGMERHKYLIDRILNATEITIPDLEALKPVADVHSQLYDEHLKKIWGPDS